LYQHLQGFLPYFLVIYPEPDNQLIMDKTNDTA
jgi:hypothetical protein